MCIDRTNPNHLVFNSQLLAFFRAAGLYRSGSQYWRSKLFVQSKQVLYTFAVTPKPLFSIEAVYCIIKRKMCFA